MFVSCFATCVYPHVMPTCYESLFISVSAELHTLSMILLMSPENYSCIYPSYCHFSGLLTDTVKGSGSQSSSFLYSYFPQVLTVREQEKEGRGKGPGEERSRPRSASSWYEVEINPSFPNSQTIPKLEQNRNHQRLRVSSAMENSIKIVSGWWKERRYF